MEPVIITAIIGACATIGSAVIAAIAASSRVNKQNAANIALMTYQIDELKNLVHELREELHPFSADLPVLKHRVSVLEDEVKEMREGR